MHRTAARPAPLDFLLPSAHAAFGIDRRKDIGSVHSQVVSSYLEAPVKGGLQTPPADDMGTAYQHPQHPPYGSRQSSTCSISGTTPSSYAGTCSGSSSQRTQYSAPHSSLSQPSHASSIISRNGLQNPQSSYGQQPSSPQLPDRSNVVARSEDPLPRKNAHVDTIVPNLQIPSSINNSGGSLAEFAAQITCLFWFESTETLQKAENLSPYSSPVKRLRDEATPSSGFRKWVVTILSTTQVTQNVILLALLFIYRLKNINPAVKGRSGSEYRLLTVALMLGNKFLDDNTYTNKTWAEVSGISVNEIHVMEVEFLSNMRYSLLASKEQWQEWQEKLGKFWIYCDRASKAPLPHVSPQSVPTLTPTLPSPPGSLQASPPSHAQSLASGYSSSSAGFSQYAPQWPVNYVTSSSPLATMPEQELRSSTRKRSYGGDAQEPSAKRVTRSSTKPVPFPSNGPIMRADVPRLPVPNLIIPTSQPLNSSYTRATSLSQNAPVLPPINGRMMSTVYPSTPSWTPNVPLLAATGQSVQHEPQGTNGYSTPSRRQSPHSVQDLLSLGSSPISATFPSHSPGHISPSFFLQQRNSPYKPVRNVNTLLYPPPSASMQGFSANLDQMHYQPLGRRNDYRPGVVPEYTSHNAYQQWPVLPQPNFHA
ncbi:Cyclin-like protein [Venustampulla echinocandica]|uniref:Cyclin-like protein n=1 Tax=Venustampulla echinocandica TaxID=2656787 RepID=A0A370TVG5_9HELO|nr:Cyclin-like protein [Venustampulla echinocandica]RDL39527.1 Cyclin-like protein [Venustampulla echinocandica]